MSIGIGFTFTERDLRSLSKRLDGYARRAQNLEPFFDDASSYMVNVVRNRILRSKRDPNGNRWAALSQATIDIKGHGRPLFHTGELARSIYIDMNDRSGFMIGSDTGIAPYAAVQNYGFAPTSGFIKGKKIPARPFMGVSPTNVKVMSSMLKEYVAGRAMRAPGFGEE